MSPRQKYKRLREKYKLPPLEKLEAMFAFKLGKDSENVLFDVCKGIFESIEFAKDILEPILFLNEGSKPSDFYEASLIEKRKCFSVYKKVMGLRWKYAKLYFDSREKNLVSFINESYEIWKKDIQKKLIELTDKLEKGWKNYKIKSKEEKQTYLG
ncbi:MAG: hypothetical protein J7L45_01245 [Candidatus Aenigmarchaeota archaeon]|nr:hypothetical protein [Candidatus Aenigmarchaeota archaeon]